MKRHPAIAVLDFADIPAGVLATDAMVKKSPIALLRCGTVTDARFLTVIGGSTAAVAEAYAEGLYRGGPTVLDHVFLADVHPHLHAGLFGHRETGGDGTMAVLTADAVSATVRAAEAALKGTPVTLVEIRLADSGLAGKGLIVLRGELHDVEAAIALSLASAGPERQVSHRVLTAPHDALWNQLDSTTLFERAAVTELDGEGGQMLLGRVIGTVVPCAVTEGLEGTPMLLLQPLDRNGKPAGRTLVAADATRMAGPGELVYYEGGREAALALEPSFVPVDHTIVGIVDDVHRVEQESS